MSDNTTPKKSIDSLETYISYAFKKNVFIEKPSGEISTKADICPNCGNGNSGAGFPGERQTNALQSDIDNSPNITQSETSLAYFGEYILFGFNDSNDLDLGQFSGYAFSSDSGVTWCDCGSVPLGGSIILNSGDPVIAVDSQEIFYYGHLGTITEGPNVIIVNTAQVNAADRTLQFNDPIVVGVGESPESFLQDKEWIAVGADKDQPGSQALYTTWTDFLPLDVPEISRIRFSKFTTGSTPTEIIGSTTIASSTLNETSSYLQGSFPVIDAAGNIYVFYEQVDLTTNPQTAFIYMVKSEDGGANFSAPILIEDRFTRSANSFTNPCSRPAIQVDPVQTKMIRMNDSPHAVAGTDNTLYVVWNSGKNLATTGIDILLAYSTDGGITWNKVPITSTNTHEFFPSVTFNCGRAHIQYSRFNDPNNVGGVGDGTFALFKKSFSTIEGLSTENQVSTVFSSVPVTNPNFDPFVTNCYMGDYNQIVAGPGNALYHAWGDNRSVLNENQNPDVFFIQTECVPAPTTPAPTTPAPTTPAPTTPAPTTPAPTTPAPTTPAPTTPAPTTPAPTTPAPTTPAPTTPAPTTPAPTTPAPTTPAPTTPAPTTPAPTTPAPTTPAPTTPAPTTPAPTTPAPTTPAPTLAPCPCCSVDEKPVVYAKCEFAKSESFNNITLNCVGRLLDVNVTLTGVCPNKFVTIGVLVYEGSRLLSSKVCKLFTGSGTNCIPSLNAGKFCFVFDDAPCPPARTLTVKVVANYVER